MIMVMSLVMIMLPLRYLFQLDHKKLMFVIMITMILMFMIIMSLVGTRPYSATR